MKKIIASGLALACVMVAHLAAAQCTYTTIKNGNFSDPTVYAVTGTGCASTPVANSIIVINNDVILDKNFSSTGSITIGATGSLVQDATNRTLTFNGGSLAIADAAARTRAQLSLAVLDFTKTTAIVGANDVVQVSCTLFTGNQTTVSLGNNALLNVLGNVDVSTGNPGITGPATGTPAGLRISGNIVNNSGGGAKLFQTTNLIACVQGNSYPSGCGTASSTSIVAPPASNDPTCFTVLPVTLTRFAASRATEGTATLNWGTATELNNNYFAVERSITGLSFETLAQVKGAGSSVLPRAYTYTDTAPLPTVAYYRLRQVDYDGTTSYSPVVALSASSPSGAASWLLPATELGGYSIAAELATNSSVLVLDVLGQPVFTQALSAGHASFQLPALPAGVYFFRLVGPQGHRTVRQALAAIN